MLKGNSIFDAMPPRIQNNKEPLERLKDLVGFKWSYVITFLIGLYVPIFGIGYFFGGLSARTEMKEAKPVESTKLSAPDSTITIAEYEKIIVANFKERQMFKDSIDALSKKVEVFYRVVKEYKNEHKAKK